MEQPLISIIIPVYNSEKYLQECIDSVINQTYKNLEIMLIDDGSTDSSDKICDYYTSTDSRVKCFHIENAGASAARNYGIERSNGKFIVFVDGDDILHDKMVERLYAAVYKDAELAICSCRYIRDNTCETVDKFTQKQQVIKRKELLEDLYYLKKPYRAIEITAVWGKIYLRSLIGSIRFDTAMNVGEDFLFNYYYINQINQAAILAYKGYGYRINDDSVMHSPFDEKKYQTFERIKELTVINQKNLGFVTRMINIAIILLLMINQSEQRNYFIEITNFIKKYRWQVLCYPKSRLKVKASLALSYGGFENMIKLYKKINHMNN